MSQCSYVIHKFRCDYCGKEVEQKITVFKCYPLPCVPEGWTQIGEFNHACENHDIEVKEKL